MATTSSSFTAAELHGEHYRPIGQYDSFEKAREAMEQHFRNVHGGAGSFRTFRPEDASDPNVLVEAASLNGDAMAIRTLYKIFERRSAT